MNRSTHPHHPVRWPSLAGALAMSLLATTAAMAADVSVSLSGAQEVPPVTTAATGSGTITINPDKTVSGRITTQGIVSTVAHIHQAPAGKNGPVIVPLTKAGDNEWTVPPGARLSDEQYAAFQSGGLYVNVHSAANPGGEIRAQLKP